MTFAATELFLDYVQAYVAAFHSQRYSAMIIAGHRVALLLACVVCSIVEAAPDWFAFALCSLSLGILGVSALIITVRTRGPAAPIWRTVQAATGYWAGSLVGNIRQLEPSAVGVTLGTSVAGVFALSSRLVNPLLIFTSTLQTLFMPVLSSTQEGSAEWNRARRTVFWLCVFYAGALCLGAPFAPLAVSIVLGSDFAGIPFLLQGVIVATALSAMTNYFQIVFNARGFAWDAALIIGAGNVLSVLALVVVGVTNQVELLWAAPVASQMLLLGAISVYARATPRLRLVSGATEASTNG
ncbi:hypothetical protein QP735_14190 [Curtobacterium citreum]|uniref:hypothetical protein n=1 Tax=Curtobacterium citreum TaxID=2036 RepID=UPI00254FFE63|nr:hypothetical protein [Curtobacterium citreum]MDK8173676.1 hypothetical protein [Curtobacterium citreum]